MIAKVAHSLPAKYFLHVWESFPVQLLLLHVRRNLVLLLFWLFLFGFISSSLGNLMGIPYLFLDPEYLDNVSWAGMGIMGFSLGIFFMSFQMVSYILYAHRYAFLGSVGKPFLRFAMNNSLLPLLLFGYYLVSLVWFQYNHESKPFIEVALLASVFIVGLNLSVWLIFLYFSFTDKDVFRQLAGNLNQQLSKNVISRVNVLQRMESARRNKKLHRVTYYFHRPWQIRATPESDSFDSKLVLKIFDQNHLNAVILQLILIATVLFLGFFKQYEWLQLPAAASVLIIFSFFTMIIGALTYWLREWAVPAMLLLVVLANVVVKSGYIDSNYKAFGLDYCAPKAGYNLRVLSNLTADQNFSADKDKGQTMLEAWKQKQDSVKPKLIILSVSGGGQRAALWSLHTMSRIDSMLNGKLMRQCVLITGASGGLIGAALYRELYLRYGTAAFRLATDTFYHKLGKDLLNPIIFSIAVGDNLYALRSFTYAGRSYKQDRGYSFEQKLLKNTDFLLDKRLSDYADLEASAAIPMLLINPTVVNDGRKLYLSAMPVAYMCKSSIYLSRSNDYKLKGIEFMRMFEKQQAHDLRFVTALRMSATFPYITPNISLPSTPSMEIIDAGMSDNFGIGDAIRFLHVFKDWIEANSSGVIIVSIRDSRKQREVLQTRSPSLAGKLLTPIGSLYSNWDNMQDINNDSHIEYASTWLNVPIQLIPFQYFTIWKNERESYMKAAREGGQPLDDASLHSLNSKEERVSLSWHLTRKEKQYLKDGFYDSRNIYALRKLRYLLESTP